MSKSDEDLARDLYRNAKYLSMSEILKAFQSIRAEQIEVLKQIDRQLYTTSKKKLREILREAIRNQEVGK